MFLNKELTETAFKIYVLLFDRTKVSAINEDYKNNDDCLYVKFSYSKLKEKLNVTDKPIANALNLLEEKRLIYREHNFNNATNIYVKYISNDD